MSVTEAAAMNWEAAVRSLIDDPARQDEVRDNYYDLPVVSAMKRFHESAEWASVRRWAPLAGERRALDVGAGNGVVSYALAKDGWSVTAIEPDPSDLVGCGAIRRLAESQQLRIEVIQGVTSDLEHLAGTFDAIFVRQVFHHAPDIRQFTRELRSLLKPGGKLITWRDHVISRRSDLSAFFDQHPLHHLYGGENAYTETEYAGALTGAGFRIERIWRQFDDPMNYGPSSPPEIFARGAAKRLPATTSRAIGEILGSPLIFGAISPLMSLVDKRPGRLVAFLSSKPLS